MDTTILKWSLSVSLYALWLTSPRAHMVEDHIHPDWEAKLAAVRAAVARRANRRIIMRQVGDRLIPVGVTSGRVHAIPAEEGGLEGVEGSGDRGSRRRRRQQNQDINQFLGSVGLGGQDLEEVRPCSGKVTNTLTEAIYSSWLWRPCGFRYSSMKPNSGDRRRRRRRGRRRRQKLRRRLRPVMPQIPRIGPLKTDRDSLKLVLHPQ